ncbi:hypothetical protein GCM10023205_70260 [Yinghuangia aomiensis]|uniref:Uncharacterized protein n=1 Tax=Yinghuangia aomiensis TaxID=676205 RepID=A0ABP9I5N8_9ACTN
MPVTMVVRSIATTARLMRNWAEGHETLPVTPVPSAIAVVRMGWRRMGWWRMQAAVLSPAGVRRLGLVDAEPDD